MRRITFIILIIYLSLAVVSADQFDSNNESYTLASNTIIAGSLINQSLSGKELAVLEFVSADSLTFDMLSLSDQFRANLAELGGYSVMPAAHMLITPEHLKMEGTGGCSTLDCMIEIGRSFGIDYIVGGKIAKNADLYSFSVILVELANGTIQHQADYETEGGFENLRDTGMRALAAALLDKEELITATGEIKEASKIPYRFETGHEEAVFVQEDLFASPIAANIYSFDTRSPKKAFFYSLVLPGAGEFYGKSKIKPFIFFGIEATLWTMYFLNDGKGDDKKRDYQDFAYVHYEWADFMQWWETLDDAQQDTFSHRLPWDNINRRPIYNHEYFENIGKYDQFQLGWDDINAYPPGVPGGIASASPHRETYLGIRKEANDFYQTANTMIMLSLGNRVISAFDAALTVKNYNKGQKRYAIHLKSHDFGNGQVPLLTCSYRF